ncbi:MAG: helix-turn-helix domain-containing protein [Planctomycetota bacterium]
MRELEHLVAKAFLLRDGEVVDGFGLAPGGSGRVPEGAWPVLSLAEAEARTIRAALAACDGDKTKAARLLGISRTTLYEKLKKLPD